MIEYVNRSGSNCYKWDSAEAQGKLPLWVADMDFKAAPAIIKALTQRVEHGVFGYGIVPDEYFESLNHWFTRRHSWSGICKENSIATIGVVPAISAVLNARKMSLAEKDECRKLKVMTFTPAYNCFFSSIRNMDADLIDCPLKANGDGYYTIDFGGDFESKLQEADVLLLCNPHNPTGRVWTKLELQLVADACKKAGVYVISDEIHCEFMMPDYHYTPFANVYGSSDAGSNYCVLTSASKAFNIAGLQCANIYVPNKHDYELIDKAINIHEVCDLNPFGVVATMAAYDESEQWLDELNELIYQNYLMLKDYLQCHLPQLLLTPAEGTYLAWVNIKQLGMSAEQFCHLLAEQQKVMFNPSEMYGCTGYIRINLATQQSNVQEALVRLRRFVENLV